MATLSNSEFRREGVNAALSGFASQYGSLSDRQERPCASQAETVFASMNPQLAAYNPLASSTAQRLGPDVKPRNYGGALFFEVRRTCCARERRCCWISALLRFRIRSSGHRSRSRYRFPFGLNLCGPRPFAAAHPGCIFGQTGSLTSNP